MRCFWRQRLGRALSIVTGLFLISLMALGFYADDLKHHEKGRRLRAAATAGVIGQDSSKENKTGWKPPLNAGENGAAVVVRRGHLSSEQSQRYDAGWEGYAFNEFVSDVIALNRSLPDPRDKECRAMTYRRDLPDAGVVIIFHNEAWSTLLRTLTSVLNRSPKQYLKQVVLVDDFSTFDHLKKPLGEYLASLGDQRVTLVRTESREGLIRARLLGLTHVTTAVVIFLDSHCECAVGWLEPLLDRIAENSSTVTVPVIDTIDDRNFKFHYQRARATNVGTFTWNLRFKWAPIPQSERLRRLRDIDPILTPTMAGGLFAVDRRFFHKLGTYDPGMEIWGGENLELSFRIWMCGGRLEILPCSHVGHVFRARMPYSRAGHADVASENSARVAAVWLDEYQYYFRESDEIPASYDAVKDRIELRKRLQCHNFSWYLEHVAADIYVSADAFAHGPINNSVMGVYLTIGDLNNLQATSHLNLPLKEATYWTMHFDKWTIFHGDLCLDYAGVPKNVTLLPCHGQGGNQRWSYSEKTKLIHHPLSARCLEARASSLWKDPKASIGLAMARCDFSNPRQMWAWDTSPLPGPSWRREKLTGVKWNEQTTRKN